MRLFKAGLFSAMMGFCSLFLGVTAVLAASPQGPPPANYLEVEKGPFRITYPQGENIQEPAAILLSAQKRMESRYGYVPQEKVPIIFYATPGEFQAATHKPGWMAALARKDGLHFQSIRALRAKGSLSVILTHEYTHWVQNYLTNYRCPHWLAEGLAVLESGEGAAMEKEFAQVKDRNRPSLRQIEQEIKNSGDQKKMRLAYFRAYQFSYYLEHNFGIKRVTQFLRGLGEGKDPSASATDAFGSNLEELVERWRKGGS